MLRMRKKSKILTLCLVLVATIFILTMAYITKNNTTVNNDYNTLIKFANENNYKLTSGNSFDKIHMDIKDLIKECDFVFIGTIESVDNPKITKVEPKKANTDKNSISNGSIKSLGLVDLPAKVMVNEVFKGNVGQDEVINIYQRIGFAFDNTICIDVDYNNFKEYKEKQVYVFFVTNYRDGYLQYTSKQGHLLIKDINKSNININQLEDGYEINIDRNNFSMFKDKTTLKELKDALKQK